MSRLDVLKSMCTNYSYEDIDAFSDLLHGAANIFPGVDREIARIYDVNLDTVRLWMDGSIVPDKRTQTDIVIFVHNKTQDFKDAEDLGIIPKEDMIVYDSWVPASYVPNNVAFFKPFMAQAKSFWNSIKSRFYISDVSKYNLDRLIEQAKRDREDIFHAKLTRKIAQCNKLIVKSVRKNQPSIAFRVGAKTVENVRLANAIRDYLKAAGFTKVETMFEFVLTKDGDVFVEINLQ